VVTQSNLNALLIGAWKSVLSKGFHRIHIHGSNPLPSIESLAKLENWDLTTLDLAHEQIETLPYSPWVPFLRTLIPPTREVRAPHPMNTPIVQELLHPQTPSFWEPPLIPSVDFDRLSLMDDLLALIQERVRSPRVLFFANFQKVHPEGLMMLRRLLSDPSKRAPLLLIIHYDPQELSYYQKTRPEIGEFFTDALTQGMVLHYESEKQKDHQASFSYNPKKTLKEVDACRRSLATRQGLHLGMELRLHSQYRSLLAPEQKELALNLGILFYQNKDYENALIHLLEAAEDSEDLFYLPQAYYYLGQIFLQRNQVQEANLYIQQGRAGAQKAGFEQWLALYHCLKLFQMEKALIQEFDISEYYTLVQTLEQNHLHKHMLFALYAFPNEYSSTGATKDSLWMVEKGIVLARDTGDEFFLSVGYHRKGVLMAGLEGEEAAMEFYIKAVEVREPLGEPLPLIQILNGITYSYLNQGDFSSALFYMRKGLKYLDRINDFSEMGVTLFNLAIVYLFGRDYDKAQEVCRSVLKMMQTLDMRRLPFNPQVHIRLALAFCRLRTGMIPEGLGTLLSAEKELEQLSEHFTNLYYITKGWASALQGDSQEEIMSYYALALESLPQTKTFRKRSTCFLMTEFSQALSQAGFEEQSQKIWAEASKLSDQEEWQGFRSWFKMERSAFFLHKEVFPSLPISLSVFEALLTLKQTGRGLNKFLNQHWPKRFTQLWLEWFPLADLANATNDDLQVFANQITHWVLYPDSTAGYDKAEVTLGGVDTDEVSSKTFEAKKQAGLYFIGEVLDVTGQLGGFNFQWAWASGVACGLAL